jgi:two-component system cell cycle sensor histidine kinase/response regulator CckA
MSHQAEMTADSRTRLEAAKRRRVLEMAKGLSATLGKDFFNSLTQHLAGVFHADFAYVGELTGAHQDRIRTLAAYRKDGAPEDFQQGLSGTAAGRVLRDGVCICRKDATRMFPLDAQLSSLNAQGYAGIRLYDSVGQSIGVLAIASKQRLADAQLVESLLETFAPRTAAELERKRAEDVHRKNEERYHAFVSTNPDAMWRIEFSEPIPLSLPEDEQIERIYRFGYVAECNAAAARLIGAESAEKLLGSAFEVVAPRADARLREELRSAIRSGFRSATIETRPIDASGQLLYRLRTDFGIVENGELRRVWGTVRDITGLRRTELSLAASERRFREVLEGVRLPAIMMDLQGAITFANECFLGLSQRSKEEAFALHWLEGVVPAGESRVWKAILQPGEKAQQATTHFEGAIIRRDGPQHAIEWSTIGLRGQDDRLEEIAAIGRDITHERLLEMEIRQAQKLESIGRLAAGVAHDFNNMLTIILGRTSQLLDQVTESDPKRANIGAIEEAATLCFKLTGQLLAFGRKQSLHPEYILLNETIVSAKAMILNLTGDGIEVNFELDPDLWRVYADGTQIQRALVNLVSNARDAMPEGGKLTIATSNLVINVEDKAYPGIQPGKYVRLSVSDSGVGLTEEVRKHIFEPFFTTKPAGKGSGFGLATVYGIVTQSGGRILAHGEPQKGATFEILLPAP